MKSLTLSGSNPSLTSMPSLERSLFNGVLTTLAASTILFGLIGWGLSHQANAVGTRVKGVTQTQPHLEVNP